MLPRLTVSVLGAGLGLAALWPTLASAQSFTLKDMTGRTVQFDKPASRIITIPLPAASMLISLDGSASKLVGMHSGAMTAITTSVLGDFFPEAKSIATNVVTNADAGTGFSPSVESIAALHPDLVIQWGDRGDDLVTPLTNAGIRTALITYGNEQQARDMMAFVGKAIGNDAKVTQLLDWRAKTEASLKEVLGALPAEKQPKVLYMLRAKEKLQVAGTGTYNDYHIKLAGGINAAKLDGQKPVNAEQIAAWNPDVIMLNTFEDNLDPSAIYDDPVLKQTNAGRDHRVYVMPVGGYRWDPPSQESPLGWEWMAQLLHPDMVNFDLRKDIATWYPILYGHAPSAAQIDRILNVAANGKSAGYDRFISK